MIFRRIHTSNKQKKDQINWRGHEVTRIEAFSDAIFAFAITLLIVSLEVPKSFEELLENLHGFIPFSISFIIFFQIWTAQNLFFRRYGMHDETTLGINAALLFMMLFFVYPMKFLWNMVFLSKGFALHDRSQIIQLYYIYSGGFALIYLLLALMYANAYRRREHMLLTRMEVFETCTYIYRHFGISLVGLFSLTLAAIGSRTTLGFAGISYALIGPVVGIIHARRAKLHKKLFGTDTDNEIIPVEDMKGE